MRPALTERDFEPYRLMRRLLEEICASGAHGDVTAAVRQVPGAPDDPGNDRRTRRARAARVILPFADDRIPFETVLRTRTAVRVYDRRSLPLDVIGAALSASEAGDRQAWPSEREAGSDLEYFLVAWRVAGLAPASYRYLPADHSLEVVGPAPSGAAAETIVAQLELAQAAAVLIVCGDLAASLTRHGGHGYRLLLARAGAAGHHAWLAALGQGAVGALFSAVIPYGLRGPLRVDGYARATLFALALGLPADPALADGHQTDAVTPAVG